MARGEGHHGTLVSRLLGAIGNLAGTGGLAGARLPGAVDGGDLRTSLGTHHDPGAHANGFGVGPRGHGDRVSADRHTDGFLDGAERIALAATARGRAGCAIHVACLRHGSARRGGDDNSQSQLLQRLPDGQTPGPVQRRTRTDRFTTHPGFPLPSYGPERCRQPQQESVRHDFGPSPLEPIFMRS